MAYQTNRKRGRCRCCGQADCSCGTCNYVVVLLFCGERELTDQYEVYFQGQLIATITDDATADGCRVFVIGNVSDVCASVITALQTEYGEDAVQIGQTTAMDDVSECDDEIEGDADCDELTIRVLPLDGVTVTDMSYKIYTVCHDEALTDARFTQDGTARKLQDGTTRYLQGA